MRNWFFHKVPTNWLCEIILQIWVEYKVNVVYFINERGIVKYLLLDQPFESYLVFLQANELLEMKRFRAHVIA